MMQKIQRFGAAMFVPVLFFAFYGVTVGLSILFLNTEIVGSIANKGTVWYNIWYVIQQGAWTVFNQLPLLFVVGLPIALSKKAQARACLESLVIYLTFNYFINAILTISGSTFGVNFDAAPGVTDGVSSGLALIAGIKTLDTGMIGAILIAGISVYLHGKFFEKKLPDFLGIFQGSVFVALIGFFIMIPIALIMCFVWPKVQLGIGSLQSFLASSGVAGVWIYTFLERILIPTGLHHFIYGPFIFGPAVVENGIAAYWAQNFSDFATSAQSLRELFPAGGFALHGSSKIFGSTGIALAIYATAKPEKKKVVAGLLIPATLTAIVAGITEPLEFTFLFVAPVLFGVHAVLAASLAAVSYAFGVSGNFGGGLIEWISLNWLPLFKYHSGTYITQIVIGLIFTAIYFFVFRFLILKFNFLTPGREADDEEAKLYTKADYKDKKANVGNSGKAASFLEALGGSENIQDVTNCATRLRVTVKDETKLASDKIFKEAGAHGVVRKGKAIQVIVGLSVPQVREEFEALVSNDTLNI
ncbi:alpha-glucoside-specific PTS transporter subunit IIBC [Clostridium sp. UBA1652]|uniref:alpha-glucoside-specific PTS transporter subunit IIBC n=1 Tax=Clostridium sp. UBA1652 TaxID=1946348 RepID=UPI00257E66C9|nr:alpha-glucoside-specific PTS transporter subunit IIBC [Clostridium sp. UBA1652]